MLTSGRFQLLSVAELTSALETGSPLPPRGIVVTIDDGFISVYRLAWPRLKAAGVPFALYINPEPIDQGSADHVSWDQLREMAADPLVTVGSHGYAHAHMVRMSAEAARADLAKAARRLEEELGETPESFAYPYGEYGLALRQLVVDSGVKAAFATQSGATGSDADLFALPRFNIGGDHADMARFDMVTNVLPLPLSWTAPRDPLLTPPKRPSPSPTGSATQSRLRRLPATTAARCWTSRPRATVFSPPCCRRRSGPDGTGSTAPAPAPRGAGAGAACSSTCRGAA